MKQTKTIIVILLLTFVLTACDSGAVQTIEVTRIVSQSFEVTRIIQQTVIATRVVENYIAKNSETAISNTVETTPVKDSGYYDGITIITRYYTFLGHNLYEEAYQLLSSSAQNTQSLEDYVTSKQRAFKTVEII